MIARIGLRSGTALLLSMGLGGCSGMESHQARGTLAPLDFVRFCMDYRSECRSDRPNAVIALTLQAEGVIADVNKAINHRIAPVTRTAPWRIYPAAGNCNDYVVTKRHELIKRGFPPSALLIATALTPAGEGHLLLVLRTDRGERVLDNLTDEILPPRRTSFTWLTRQSGSDPHIWEEISAA
jgi:predicted transglutaminase-like cysteine proteinase